MNRTSSLCLTALLLVAAAPALAAGNADWVQPATGLFESLESGMVKIGSVAVGIGVIVVGLAACVMGRMDWSKMGGVVIGGLLIMAGPAALRALLEAAR